MAVKVFAGALFLTALVCSWVGCYAGQDSSGVEVAGTNGVSQAAGSAAFVPAAQLQDDSNMPVRGEMHQTYQL